MDQQSKQYDRESGHNLFFRVVSRQADCSCGRWFGMSQLPEESDTQYQSRVEKGHRRHAEASATIADFQRVKVPGGYIDCIHTGSGGFEGVAYIKKSSFSGVEYSCSGSESTLEEAIARWGA